MNITIITNNPPHVEFGRINPEFPSTLDTLDCGFTITDLDQNDILTANITWSKDNLPHDSDNETLTVINGSLANTTMIGDIEPEDTNTDEEWVCIVTADDGEMTTMKLSNTTTIIRQMVANLSLLSKNGLTAIYEFTVINPYPATSEFPWILNLGNGNQVSNATNISLVQNEDDFVYVEYIYSVAGQYNVTARVTNFDITDEETIEVTI